MTKGYTDKDRGWQKLKADLRKLGGKGLYASVGIQGDKAAAFKKGGGKTNVEIATYHEFGDQSRTPPRPPERSFLRSTFDQNQSKYQKGLDRIAGNQLSAPMARGELILLGEEFRADIITKIKSGIAPGLSDETKKRKNEEDVEGKEAVSTPLIDTKQMLNSIDSVVTHGKKAAA